MDDGGIEDVVFNPQMALPTDGITDAMKTLESPQQSYMPLATYFLHLVTRIA